MSSSLTAMSRSCCPPDSFRQLFRVVGIFGIQPDGTLESLGAASGLAATAAFNGLAAH
ncbi:MAG TPA: hypothetical protein VGG04_18635 [Candidatus Sulfotelmatobacter sp.]